MAEEMCANYTRCDGFLEDTSEEFDLEFGLCPSCLEEKAREDAQLDWLWQHQKALYRIACFLKIRSGSPDEIADQAIETIKAADQLLATVRGGGKRDEKTSSFTGSPA